MLLASLIIGEDRTVFEQTLILRKLLNWLKRQTINPNQSAHNSLIIVIDALKEISGKDVTTVLLPFTNSSHKEIRNVAYQALLNLPDLPSLPLINKALSESLPEIQNLALEAAKKHAMKLPEAILLELINQGETAKSASQLFANPLTEKSKTMLATFANDQNKAFEIRMAALTALSGSHTSSTKNILKGIVFDRDEKLEIRRVALHLLATISHGNDDIIKLTHLRHDPLSNEALKTLAMQNNKHVLTLLWRKLSNANEKDEERVLAAKILYPINPQKTISLIQGMRQ